VSVNGMNLLNEILIYC